MELPEPIIDEAAVIERLAEAIGEVEEIDEERVEREKYPIFSFGIPINGYINMKEYMKEKYPDIEESMMKEYGNSYLLDKYSDFYLNPDNILVKARLGQLLLNPVNFEQAAKSPMQKYPGLINFVHDVNNLIPPTIRIPGSTSELPFSKFTKRSIALRRYNKLIAKGRRGDFVGWSKAKLVAAIRQTFGPTGITTTGYDFWRTGQFRRREHIVIPDMVRPTLFQLYRASNQNPGSQVTDDRPLIGFGKSTYMPYNYYATIYRMLFQTPRIYDWPEIAAGHLLSRRVIAAVAQQNYGLRLGRDFTEQTPSAEIVRMMLSRVRR